MSPFILYAAAGIGLLAGSALAAFVIPAKQFDAEEEASKAAHREEKAHAEGETKLQKAHEHANKLQEQRATEHERLARYTEKHKQLITTKNETLERREERNEQMGEFVRGMELDVRALQKQHEQMEIDLQDKLRERTGMTVEEAHEMAKQQALNDFAADSDVRLAQYEEFMKDESTKIARNILAEAVQRYSAAAVMEQKTTDVFVSRDNMKGKIVGKDGRNIVYFEQLFEVVVVFNDMPNIISLSAFNLVSREIARTALEWLLRQKNIDEKKIDESKAYAEKEVHKILQREGDKACRKLGLERMSDDFKALVGRLQFRTSYGQNIMRHSQEVGYLARLLAAEIGANEQTAWFGGFFHDLGKAIDQEVGGSHDVLSKELLEKYNFDEGIVHAAYAHHDAVPPSTPEALLVKAADALSASRPGARAESMERYIKRIKMLEETALSFMQIKKAYAISAGREVRAHIDPYKADDQQTQELAEKIAGLVQQQGGYPGKIKITTIRTTRTTEHVSSK